jgi:hypothetical protein
MVQLVVHSGPSRTNDMFTLGEIVLPRDTVRSPSAVFAAVAANSAFDAYMYRDRAIFRTAVCCTFHDSGEQSNILPTADLTAIWPTLIKVLIYVREAAAPSAGAVGLPAAAAPVKAFTRVMAGAAAAASPSNSIAQSDGSLALHVSSSRMPSVPLASEAPQLLQRADVIGEGRPSFSKDVCCRCGAVLPAKEAAAPPLAAAASGAGDGSEMPASTRTAPLRVCGACFNLVLQPLSISAGPNSRPSKRQRVCKPGELAESAATVGAVDMGALLEVGAGSSRDAAGGASAKLAAGAVQGAAGGGQAHDGDNGRGPAAGAAGQGRLTGGKRERGER